MGKRKQAAKSQDFKRTKLKVGKTQAASNATDTTIKSRSMIVPSQSISESKGQYVTNRNLTMRELFSQLKHFSSSVRRDALSGLKELFIRFVFEAYLSYPCCLEQNLPIVFERILPLVADFDTDPRKMSAVLLRHILATIPYNVWLFFYSEYISIFLARHGLHAECNVPHSRGCQFFLFGAL